MPTLPTPPTPPPLRLALFHFDECGCDECWREVLDAIRDDRLRGSVDSARATGRDRGSTLLEVLVVIVVLGIIAVPLSGFVVTLLRTVDQAQRTAERVALVTTAASIAGRVDVVDVCDSVELGQAVADRVTVDAGWSLSITSDCASTPGLAVITVDVVDDHGRHVALSTARPVTP